MGQTMVIINDAQIAIDILDKRSIKYSNRRRQVFAGEMYVLPAIYQRNAATLC